MLNLFVTPLVKFEFNRCPFGVASIQIKLTSFI